jgi:3-oxoacyl-[acyl-carrier protein] reductase
MKLDRKIALITGAGSGFGAEMARMFAANGACVLVNDLNEKAAISVAAEIGKAGGSAIAMQGDVSKNDDVCALVSRAMEEFGGLDIYVNNAGYSHTRQSLLEVSEEEFDRIYAVNVKSIYLSALHAVPTFRAQRSGVILNIASTAGQRPRPGLTWYNGSKGAVITLTKSMAVELAPDNIRVNAINPVIGETGMMTTFMGGEDTPEMREKFISTIPLGRMSQPKDIACAALFLVSDDAEFITGVCMEVDGGRCI